MTGEVIAGRYRLLEPLGHGSMSSVWHAHDEELARDVAVKTLAPTADRARFEREARAVAALSHPNVCTVYDYGESDGKPYMVLEYLPGGTLEDRLGGAPLPDADTERYATQIASGLAHAHAQGVVHRDLKPANVLFDSEGRPKIADFGIARMGNDGTLTEAGTVLGTAAYISPEQAAGLPATTASDVYSFGVILFRMLTGRLPFVAGNAMELVRMNRDDPPPAVTDIRPAAPAALAWTADASLAKDPGVRPRDGAALLAALRDDTAATMVMPAAATQLTPRRRRPLLPAAILLALALLLGGVALALATSGGGDGSSGTGRGGGNPSMSIPTVPTVPTTSTRATTTQPASTTSPTTSTRATTTTHTTTAHTTTAHTTTAHTTTAHTTTAHTTTATPPPTTTYATTTTDTTPTTTGTTVTDTTPTTT